MQGWGVALGRKALWSGGSREGLACPLQHTLPHPCPLGPFSLCCPLCHFLLSTAGQPTWSPWTPWRECSASCGPAQRHIHCFYTGPPSGVPYSVAPLPLLASAPTLCPGPKAEEEPCLLLECDRKSHGAQTCQLPCLSQAHPLTIASSSIPQELKAGALGDPGQAVTGAVVGWGSPELEPSL